MPKETNILEIYDRMQMQINIEQQTTDSINDWLIQKHRPTPSTYSLAREMSEPNKLFKKDITPSRIIDYESEVNDLNRRFDFTQSTISKFETKISSVREIINILIEEASTEAFEDEKISKIVTTEEERQRLTLREKQIVGNYMRRIR